MTISNGKKKVWHKRGFWISLIAAAAAGYTAWLFFPRYAVRDYVKDVQILWHDDEFYMIVAIGRQGWTGNYFSLNLGRVLIRSHLGSDIPEPLRSDLLVFYYHKGLKEFFLKGFEPVGSISPFKGQLYNGVGGRKRRVFRWNEETFVELTDDEAQELVALQKQVGEFMEADALKKEGWQKHSNSHIPSGTTQIQIHLAKGEFTVVLGNSPKKAPFSEITMYLKTAGEEDMRPVLEVDQSWRFVDRTEYSKYAK